MTDNIMYLMELLKVSNIKHTGYNTAFTNKKIPSSISTKFCRNCGINF